MGEMNCINEIIMRLSNQFAEFVNGDHNLFICILSPECLNQVEVRKFMKLHKGMKNLNIELIPGNEIKLNREPILDQQQWCYSDIWWKTVQLDWFFLQGIPVLSKQQKNSVTKFYDKFELNESQKCVKKRPMPLKTLSTLVNRDGYR